MNISPYLSTVQSLKHTEQMKFPAAISESKKTRLELEQAHYDVHGTIEGMTDYEFRAIPLKADSEDERFENTLTAATLFDLADRIGCSEQGLREKLRAAYKSNYPCDLLTTRYKGFVISCNVEA